jgi:diacylglycerol kinase
VSKPFSVTDRARSFRYAFSGVTTLLREQHNARIHLLAAVLVVAAAAYLEVNRIEWAVLLLCIALVWTAEALNSALEYLCDAAVAEEHPLIGKAKDVAAAGVLVCALVAAVIAVLVFMPYL